MRSRVLADGWYAWGNDGFLPFTDWIERRSPGLGRLAWRFAWLRGLLLFAASTRHAALAVIYRDRDWRSRLLLRACLGRERKLVILHLIEKDARSGRAAGLIDRVWAAAS